jgi:dihydroorotase
VAGLNAGTLSVGAVADVVLFDAGAHWTVERSALASQGKHTPFLGYNVAGKCKPPSWPATLLTNADPPA